MNTAPLEAKVVASSGAALLVTTAFAVLHWLAPAVGAPPDYVTGLLVTLVTLAAGYLAPHTTRLKPLTLEELAALDHVLAGPQPAVSYETGTTNWPAGSSPVQPPASPAAPLPEGKTTP